MDAGLILPVIAVVLLSVFVVWRYGETVESAYNTFDYLRRLIGALIVVLVAWTFLRSGNTYLFAVALALVAFATIWFLIERPDQDIV